MEEVRLRAVMDSYVAAQENCPRKWLYKLLQGLLIATSGVNGALFTLAIQKHYPILPYVVATLVNFGLYVIVEKLSRRAQDKHMESQGWTTIR